MTIAPRRAGFTLIEILVSMIIFTIAVLAITRARTVSLRNVQESQWVFEGTQLAANKMTEMELKYKNDMDKGGVDAVLNISDEGTFEEPYAKYSWKTEVTESTLKFSRAIMEQFLTQLGIDKDSAADKAEEQRLVLANLNKMIKNNFVEVHLTVKWKEYGKNYSVPLVTHIMPTKPKIEITQTGDD